MGVGEGGGGKGDECLRYTYADLWSRPIMAMYRPRRIFKAIPMYAMFKNFMVEAN